MKNKKNLLKIYPKLYIPSTLNTDYLLWAVAHMIDCVCSKILDHGLNDGLLFSFLMFFVWKKTILNLLENSGLKCRFLFFIIISVLLDVQANLPETIPFLSTQMFIVLGMYNFGSMLSYKGPFNKYVDKMRGEGVKKSLFLSTLRV